MNKTSILALALLTYAALSGCATGAPRQVAAAEAATVSDAGPATQRRSWRQPQCSTQPRDDSLQAARCARAQLMRSIGPAVPTLSF